MVISGATADNKVPVKDVFEFNLELPNKDDKANMHKVTVRLYYFPKLMEKETRPLDDGEDHRL